jgi:hypothetical protein
MVCCGGLTMTGDYVSSRSEHTFLPESVVQIIADRSCAADHPGLSAGTMRYLAGIHRDRGELLSAAQYEEMADVREEVDVGLVPGG